METSYFEEPSYNIAAYGIKLKGSDATLAHLINIAIAICSLFISYTAFKKMRDK